MAEKTPSDASIKTEISIQSTQSPATSVVFTGPSRVGPESVGVTQAELDGLAVNEEGGSNGTSSLAGGALRQAKAYGQGLQPVKSTDVAVPSSSIPKTQFHAFSADEQKRSDGSSSSVAGASQRTKAEQQGLQSVTEVQPGGVTQAKLDSLSVEEDGDSNGTSSLAGGALRKAKASGQGLRPVRTSDSAPSGVSGVGTIAPGQSSAMPDDNEQWALNMSAVVEKATSMALAKKLSEQEARIQREVERALAMKLSEQKARIQQEFDSKSQDLIAEVISSQKEASAAREASIRLTAELETTKACLRQAELCLRNKEDELKDANIAHLKQAEILVKELKESLILKEQKNKSCQDLEKELKESVIQATQQHTANLSSQLTELQKNLDFEGARQADSHLKDLQDRNRVLEQQIESMTFQKTPNLVTDDTMLHTVVECLLSGTGSEQKIAEAMGVLKSNLDYHSCYCICEAGCETGVPGFKQIALHLIHLALQLSATIKAPRQQDAATQAGPTTCDAAVDPPTPHERYDRDLDCGKISEFWVEAATESVDMETTMGKGMKYKNSSAQIGVSTEEVEVQATPSLSEATVQVQPEPKSVRVAQCQAEEQKPVVFDCETQVEPRTVQDTEVQTIEDPNAKQYLSTGVGTDIEYRKIGSQTDPVMMMRVKEQTPVRIGGGFHLLQGRERSPSPEQTEPSVNQALYGEEIADSPYVQGAPCPATNLERFLLGAYAATTKQPDYVYVQQNQQSLDDTSCKLFRVMGQPDPDSAFEAAAAAARRRPKRPSSAGSARTSAGAPGRPSPGRPSSARARPGSARRQVAKFSTRSAELSTQPDFDMPPLHSQTTEWASQLRS